MPDPSTLFRAIPSTDKSLDALARALDGRQDEDAKAILDAPHALLREAVSAYWDNMRLRVRKGLVTDPAFLSLETRLSHLIRHVARYIAPRLQKVINATGVVIHTNSGRSTLAPEARQALELAAKSNLDLVKIAPQAKPPVCKIMDYGKYRFEQAKREKEARKNTSLTKRPVL